VARLLRAGPAARYPFRMSQIKFWMSQINQGAAIPASRHWGRNSRGASPVPA
jgi:hypothetical protein